MYTVLEQAGRQAGRQTTQSPQRTWVCAIEASHSSSNDNLLICYFNWQENSVHAPPTRLKIVIYPRRWGGGRSSRDICGVAEFRREGSTLAAVSSSGCLCIAEITYEPLLIRILFFKEREREKKLKLFLWIFCVGPCGFFFPPSPAKHNQENKVSTVLSSWSSS